MAVYYKFKSAKEFDSIPIDGNFITVGDLKDRIFESKHLGKGTDYDLVVSNAQTNEEYVDEATPIPKHASLLIRRLPGVPRKPIVATPLPDQDKLVVEPEPECVQPTKGSSPVADQSVMDYADGLQNDDFGDDPFKISEVASVQLQVSPSPDESDEDGKIQALINTPALDWQPTSNSFGTGRGFGRGMAGRGFGRGGKTPPEGYVCHRCKTPGHLIQHCPTNGDPDFDIKRVKPPTGIPRSMLVATPDGSYALPGGATAVLKPNEAAFEKEIEGMPTTQTVGELPPHLHCPLCEKVMKDAVFTSKCCFRSFCDKCIRDHVISKAACVCGAVNVLADDLLPNRTLRDHVQDMESARCAPAPSKIQSPCLSAPSKGEQAPLLMETAKVQGSAADDVFPVVQKQGLEESRITKAPDVSETTHDSRSMKERVSALPADQEVQQKQVPGEAAKKKKKKKVSWPMNEMQWRTQDFAAESYMMPQAPFPHNPGWNGMQPGMEACMGPYSGGMPPYMGYGVGPLNVPFGTAFFQGPFGVAGDMLPPFVPLPPQRDLTELALGMNAGPPIMSREQFEARKSELRKKLELERHERSRELSKDRESLKEVSGSGDVSSRKLKSRATPPHVLSSSGDRHCHSQRHRHRERPPSPERHRRERKPISSRASLNRKTAHHGDKDCDYDHCYAGTDNRSHRQSEPSAGRHPTKEEVVAGDKKRKASVFSRVAFSSKQAEEEEPPAAVEKTPSKKRKVMLSRWNETSSLAAVVAGDKETSDDDERHFKRRPSRV